MISSLFTVHLHTQQYRFVLHLCCPVSNACRFLAVRTAPRSSQAKLLRQRVVLLAPVSRCTTSWRAWTAKLDVGTTAVGLKEKSAFSGLFASSAKAPSEQNPRLPPVCIGHWARAAGHLPATLREVSQYKLRETRRACLGET